MDDQKVRDILRRLDVGSGDDFPLLGNFLSTLFGRPLIHSVHELNESEKNELRIALKGIAALSVAKGRHAAELNDTKEMRDRLAELKRVFYEVREAAL